MSITIATDLIQELAEYIDKRAVRADYTIGGQTYQAGLRRSIVNGTTIRKHVYLTQKDPYGTVTRCRLIGHDGKVIATRTDQKVHEVGKGLLLEFRFEISQGV